MTPSSAFSARAGSRPGSSLNGGSRCNSRCTLRAVPRLATILLVIVLLLAALVAIAVVGSHAATPEPVRTGRQRPGRVPVERPDLRREPRRLEPDPADVRRRIGGDARLVARRDEVRVQADRPEARDRRPTRYGDIVVVNADGSNPITIDRGRRDLEPGRLVAGRSMAGLFEDRRRRRPDLHRGGRRLEPADAHRQSRRPSTGRRSSPRTARRSCTSSVRTATGGVMNRDGSDGRSLNTTAIHRRSTRRRGIPTGTAIVVSAATHRGDRPLDPVSSTGHPNDSSRVPGRAEVGPSWSPDGNRLVYLTSVDGGSFILHRGRRRRHQRATAARRLQRHQSRVVARRHAGSPSSTTSVRSCASTSSIRTAKATPIRDRERPSRPTRDRRSLLPT